MVPFQNAIGPQGINVGSGTIDGQRRLHMGARGAGAPSVQNLPPVAACEFICGDRWRGRPPALKVATPLPTSLQILAPPLSKGLLKRSLTTVEMSNGSDR